MARACLPMLRAGAAIVACAAALLAPSAQAVTIDYTLAPVDGVAGRWTYTYMMTDLFVYSNVTLYAGQTLDIVFEPGRYTDLALSGTGPGADWSVMTFQPDPALPAVGYYDLQAQVTNPDPAGPFRVSFTWTGPGTPGNQSFEIYDTDYRLITGGITAPAVPEPGTQGLMLAGLALGLGRWLRRCPGTRRAAAVLVLGLAGWGAAQAQLSVERYDLTGSRRATRTLFDYTYTVTFRNAGGALRNVVATVSSNSAATVVVDGTAAIGSMAAGEVTQTWDTVTIRQDRELPFNPASLAWTFSSDPANHAPVARASADVPLTTLGQVVNFNGQASSDADGDPLSFAWGVLNRPAGSTTAIVGAQNSLASLRLDRVGRYQVQLVVNDGKVNSVPDTLVLDASMPSHALSWLSMPYGPGSDADSLAHYASQPIARGCWQQSLGTPWICDDTPGAPSSVASWEYQLGVREMQKWLIYAPPASAIFYDDTSLALARSVTCQPVTDIIHWWNGTGVACMATNYGPAPGSAGFPNADAALGDAVAGRNPVSHSALWFGATASATGSAAGVTLQTYDVGSAADNSKLNQKLKTATQFDSEGAKQVPNACIACHGGSLDAGTHQLTGASMLPYVVADLKFSTQAGYTRADQEGPLRELNRMVLASRPNPSDPEDPIAVWIKGTYADFTRPTADDSFVPQQWLGDPPLYRKVVRPYCVGCHQALRPAINFRSSSNFRSYTARIADMVCKARTMPHAEAAFVGLRQSDALQVLRHELLADAACP